MISFENMLTGAFENVLIARCEETEQFLMLIHDVNISEFIAEFEKFCSSFTEKFNPRFPKHPIVIKAGITEFKNNEWLVKARDRIRKYKKSLRGIKENKIFFVE
ncbi:MAG: hypothetical protein LIO59_05855 [Oscillospiraceae bacterium]|nr:hypothetical protein [Oscillospiraceae bacterium]